MTTLQTSEYQYKDLLRDIKSHIHKSQDLHDEFPDLKGFSKRNLFDFRRFYLFYSSASVRQVDALKSSGHTRQVDEQLRYDGLREGNVTQRDIPCPLSRSLKTN